MSIQSSIDYILCDKQTFKPVYAIELDDYTHNCSNRQERDKEVERMLKSAGMPLVRFSDVKSLNEEEIAKRFWFLDHYYNFGNLLFLAKYCA